MSGLYGTLELGQRAVQTQRQGIELTGHNIANVDNPAFARQRIDVTTAPSVVTPDGILANDVTTAQVRQLRNALLDTNIQQETSLTSFLQTKNDVLELSKAKLGQIFLADLSRGSGEKISGLANDLNELFNRFQSLANDPGSRTHRIALIEQANALTQDFNQLHHRLTELGTQIDAEMATAADEGNGLLNEIARLNQSIEQAENQSNTTANDLRDRRTAKLEELAKITQFQTTESDEGVMSLHIDGEILVEGASPKGQFERVPNQDGRLEPVFVSDNNPKPIIQGQLGALLAVREETLIPLSQRLDQLAAELSENVNQIHQDGFDLNGGTGEAFFVGDSASTIRVNQSILDDPARIQASNEKGAVGNNEILRAIHRLGQAEHAPLSELTFANHFAETVGSFSDTMADTRSQLEDQSAIQELMTRQRNAVSGVSLDEEMTNLVKYQNAFEASARLVSVIDEMLQTVVNLGR